MARGSEDDVPKFRRPRENTQMLCSGKTRKKSEMWMSDAKKDEYNDEHENYDHIAYSIDSFTICEIICSARHGVALVPGEVFIAGVYGACGEGCTACPHLSKPIKIRR